MRWQPHVGCGLRSYSTNASSIIRIENATFYRKYPSSQDAGAYNPPIFPYLNFHLPSVSLDQHHWAVIGPSNSGKTTLFEIFRGQHICIPPNARSYSQLSSNSVDKRYRTPWRAIQHVGFNGEGGGVGRAGTRGAYLSARYESRREETDFSVKNYLQGDTELNPSKHKEGKISGTEAFRKVIEDLKLEALIDMPMNNLSNGQTRRARIARALLGQPMVLLLDEPFMGLDPPTVNYLSRMLYELAKDSAPKLILSLRPQDPVPDWITHTLVLGPALRVSHAGDRWSDFPYRPTLFSTSEAGGWKGGDSSSTVNMGETTSLSRTYEPQESSVMHRGDLSRDGLPLTPLTPEKGAQGEILMSMKGVRIKYGEKVALGDWAQKSSQQINDSERYRSGLFWDVRRGQRWGVFGSNGSGKTTLISMICSDHPQAYSQQIEIFGRSRLPKPGVPGISIFDIQSRIGQSSPEIHAFFPKRLSIRQTLENAWADTFLGTSALTADAKQTVDACLRWFERELNPAFSSGTFLHWASEPRATAWADSILFGHAPFSAQRVALFLRAMIKKPDLVILDEAFSGMDDQVRDKCLTFLTWGETLSLAPSRNEDISEGGFLLMPKNAIVDRKPLSGIGEDQALICVSHVKEEVPGMVRHWMRLPEPNTGEAPALGVLDRPLEAADGLWKEIWGM